jgi:hypothetical protein
MNDNRTKTPVGAASLVSVNSLLLHGIFDTIDTVLNVAFDFLILAVGGKLCVAQNLSRDFLDVALDLPGRTGDPIFVNHVKPLRLSVPVPAGHAAGGPSGWAGVGRPRWPPDMSSPHRRFRRYP